MEQMKDKIKQLEHLQPKLIAGALFIHNGKDIQEKIDRTSQVQRVVGDKLATYVMALLVLPQLMEQVMQGKEYKDFLDQRQSHTFH